MRASTRMLIIAALLCAAVATVTWLSGGTARAVTPIAAPTLTPVVTPIGGAAGGPRTLPDAQPVGDARSAQIKDLEQQIKTLRDQYHSQLDPLQQQIKDLREKFDPQIKSLEDQRHDLIEAGKSPAMQDLDKQEANELASLSDQEKAEIDRVHQHFADTRKDVQARYQKEREALKGSGH